MAKKHTEEEEESGDEMEVSSPGNVDSESESESESEPEPEPDKQSPPSKKPPLAAPKKPQPPEDSSSSAEESGSESESESEPEPLTQKPNPVTVKPLASKPMDDPKKSAPKPRSKPNATAKPTSPPPAKSSAGAGAKRPVAVDDAETKESKRSKKTPKKEIETPVNQKTPSEDVKRQLFQRLWSEDDEIVILKGMIDYRSKKKSDPVADLSAFHEFIKKSLHVDVSKTQLQDKIRRLKKKYENNAGKEKKGKKERTFSKPHEQKTYELSKKIWGKEKTDNKGEKVEEVDRVVENGTTSKKEQSKSEGQDNVVLEDAMKQNEEQGAEVVKREKNVEVAAQNLSSVLCERSVAELEKWLEENSGLISIEKRNEMKEKLTSLKLAEFDLCFRRVDLITEQGKLVREAMGASGITILQK
ncbi:PREDICTED: GLABROUS1 enhancer-binding protein-like [Nicotiana attenuata]|uniref:Mediator-associated protein 1 n=1 Tax=Nicotiana attenuata TaxID=49451 RepID=A0A314L8F3_NICAT|nr:PREDICTED: GLABROUS1 enhancer-binding protein-like [Nicotiana attenuata]OIT37832.1 mediator-associated protein 1 [Nicotiana attenuata]